MPVKLRAWLAMHPFGALVLIQLLSLLPVGTEAFCAPATCLRTFVDPLRLKMSAGPDSVQKPVAVITGGTRGIGLGIARSMARDGYDLVLGYSSNHEAAEQSKEAIMEEFNVGVEVVPGDVAERSTVDNLFKTAKENLGPATAWIHNAGLYLGVTTPRSAVAPMEGEKDWEVEYEYYQKVYPRCFKHGIDLGLEQGALKHVLCISSPGCNLNYNPQPNYELPGQAKTTMEFLTRVYAKRLGHRFINVNCVIPGAMGGWPGVVKARSGGDEEKAKEVRKELKELMVDPNAIPRWGLESEIGDAVAFLCSEKGTFITGVILPVDGGLHMGKTTDNQRQ